MKFIKLLKNWVDKENDKPYVPKDVLEVSDDVADELIKCGEAEAHSGVVNEIKAEDVAESVKKAVEEAMAVTKTVEKEVAEPTVEVIEDAPIWKDAGDFFDAVVKAGKGKSDERLFKNTGQNETTDADGGFLVEHRIGAEIYAAAAQPSILMPKCDIMEIGPNQNGIKINQTNESCRSATSLFGGVRVYSPAEGVAKTAFKKAFAQVDVSLGKTFAVFYATDELLQDRIGLFARMKGDVGSALNWIADDDILHGTTNTDLIEIEGHAATVAVAVAGANPTAAELSNMYISMIPGSLPRAEWYMSLSQYAACMQLEDSSGRKLIQPSFENAAYGTLFNKKINILEQCDVDAQPTSIMFLDLSQYLLIKRGGVSEASSIHVKFIEDEQCFRFGTRTGGSPKLASTVTLPDTTIVSPFVTRAV